MTKTLGSEQDGLNLNSDFSIYGLHGLMRLPKLSMAQFSCVSNRADNSA